MRRTLSNLIILIIIFARQLLEIVGAIMDIIDLPEFSKKIELLIEKHGGSFDALTIMFFFGVVALIVLNLPSIINFFKWVSNFPKDNVQELPVPDNKSRESSQPVDIEDGLLEKQLTIAWSSVDSSLFDDDISGTLVEFQCYSTGDNKYQCLPGMKNITSLNKLKDKTYDVHKLVFTNRGNEPIFKIKVPFMLECCVRNGATEKYEHIVHSENSFFFGSVNESIQPGDSMTFYLCNGSEKDYLIVVHLQDYVEANLFGQDEQVKIKYTWETFRPLWLSLRYIPDYHVHR